MEIWYFTLFIPLPMAANNLKKINFRKQNYFFHQVLKLLQLFSSSRILSPERQSGHWLLLRQTTLMTSLCDPGYHKAFSVSAAHVLSATRLRICCLGWCNVTLTVEHPAWIFIFRPSVGHGTMDRHIPYRQRWFRARGQRRQIKQWMTSDYHYLLRRYTVQGVLR